MSRADTNPSQASPAPSRRRRGGVSLAARGEPILWLGGGALAVSLLMITGLFALILWQGLATFWPTPVHRWQTRDAGIYMGEVTRSESYRPQPAAGNDPAGGGGGEVPELRRRQLIRTGNYRLTQAHFQWVDDADVVEVTRPDWAMVLERQEWGRFYGFLQGLAVIDPLAGPEGSADSLRRQLDGLQGPGQRRVAVRRFIDGQEQDLLIAVNDLGSADEILGVGLAFTTPESAWEAFATYHPQVRARRHQRRRLEDVETGVVNRREEAARLAMRRAEMAVEENPTPVAQQELADRTRDYEAAREKAGNEFAALRARIQDLDTTNERFRLLLETSGEGTLPARSVLLPLDQVVRAYPANRLGVAGRLGVYLSRWWEFISGEPREANSEGGVYPAIFGTVVMTLLMSIAVVPFGVLASLYLREYARAGFVVSAVRVAVNNLAGVPSIVFGVFGLGFFCYMLGASLDQLFFSASLPNPTYGKGGILWASLTLALLTLPVVIVATEEALSAVPNSMREGSYACGASKWQTIRRIILPRALPGITTGMILAIARGAGEVAPLMLVGAVKLAPELALDGVVPFIHPERSFMHLGFHIFDVGFQSQNSEAAKPMVYTTTLLLIAIIAFLNLAAVRLRTRLRRRFASSGF